MNDVKYLSKVGIFVLSCLTNTENKCFTIKLRFIYLISLLLYLLKEVVNRKVNYDINQNIH